MNENPNQEQAATQVEHIIQHLQSGKSITTLEALNLYGCFRLTSRIYDIKQRGVTVYKHFIKTASGKYVAQYALTPFEDSKPKKSTMSLFLAPIYIAGEFHAEAAEKLHGLVNAQFGLRHDTANRMSSIGSFTITDSNIRKHFKSVVEEFGVSICALGQDEYLKMDEYLGKEVVRFTCAAIFVTPEVFKWKEERDVSENKYYDHDIDGITPLDRKLMAVAAGVEKVEFAHTHRGYPMFWFKDGRRCLLKDFAKPITPKPRRSLIDMLFHRKKEAVK
jgi:hypothetical protein